MTDCCQVTTTLPDQAAADKLATALVEERLAACAQVIGPVSSTYRWRSNIEHASEWYCQPTARPPEAHSGVASV